MIKIFFFLLFLNSNTLQAEWEPFKQEWVKCESKEDCVAIEGACPTKVAVNKKHKKVASEYYKKISPFVECAKYSAPKKPLVPECGGEVKKCFMN